MNDILDAPFIKKMVSTIAAMYTQGWDERNAGNISVLLSAEELAPYLPELTTSVEASSTQATSNQGAVDEVIQQNASTVTGSTMQHPIFPLGFTTTLADAYLLVTRSGSYFRCVAENPARDLGLIRITEDGQNAELIWGFSAGGWCTSELPAHLMSHEVRLAVDPKHKVVMHCHPTNLLALTFVHELDERAFTHSLWQMCSECMMIFPDGIGVLPWMLCGTTEIGQATAEKLKDCRLVVWAQHGIYGTGATLDEAFGLIETAEKAAKVYLKIAPFPRLNTISDEGLRQIADAYNITPREGWLD